MNLTNVVVNKTRKTHHPLNVRQLKEEHEFDSDDTDVIGPYISHVHIEARGHRA